MRKLKVICLSLLCAVLLSACGNDDAAHTAASEPVNPESAASEPTSSESTFSEPVSSEPDVSVPATPEPVPSEPEPESSEEPIVTEKQRTVLQDFEYRPYLKVDETTQLPETLPIYEDEFPTFKSQAQYPLDELREEDAKASMGEYLRLLGGITGQPVPEIEVHMEELSPAMGRYLFDDVNEQIVQMQYMGDELAIRGTPENSPNLSGALETTEVEGILSDPLIQAAIAYQKIESPKLERVQRRAYDEDNGRRYIRIADQTDDFKENLICEYFGSVKVRSGPTYFRIFFNPFLPERPLEEAGVVPYETAKEFIETQTACPVVYCEAVYDRNNIYPGRYIPVYKFFLQGDGYVSIYLVPMADYYIPQGEEMQQYMDESFGEYAGTYYDPKYTNGSYHVLY